MSGATFPVTLNPGLAVKVEVRFEPIASRAATGQLTIQSNSSTNARAVVSLSGTGGNAQHEVSLNWRAPSGSTSSIVVGYNIYRLTAGSYAYQRLNSSVDTEETYVDSTVQADMTYAYIVESVASSGVESVPSNVVVVTIP
jgi:fibronectin type 3 domain-containing protein